jgi:hypothetical protein
MSCMRLAVRKTLTSYPYEEFESHLLRHCVRVQYSPQAFVPVQIRNNRGPSHKDLRTARWWVRPDILSLGALVSKPPHFANLVRIS